MLATRTLLFLAMTGASGAALAANMAEAPPPAVFVSKAAQDGMVTDHGKANRELASIAKQKGIDAPQKLDTEHQNMVRKLEAQDGEAFDLEYSRHMNMDHDKAIDLFEATSKSSDTDLAGFAKKTLPTLKEHKQMASKLPGQ